MNAKHSVAPQLVVLDTQTLAELVRSAVLEAFEANAMGAPRLLTREGIARALQCSPGHIDGLRKRGLPEVRLGETAVRFDLPACLAWLAENDNV